MKTLSLSISPIKPPACSHPPWAAGEWCCSPSADSASASLPGCCSSCSAAAARSTHTLHRCQTWAGGEEGGTHIRTRACTPRTQKTHKHTHAQKAHARTHALIRPELGVSQLCSLCCDYFWNKRTVNLNTRRKLTWHCSVIWGEGRCPEVHNKTQEAVRNVELQWGGRR